MYDHGRGVVANDPEAMKWFRRAADQGAARAQFNLATAYAEGHGVPQDSAQAVKWYRRAADQNRARRSTTLDSCTQGERLSCHCCAAGQCESAHVVQPCRHSVPSDRHLQLGCGTVN
jgi:hypothetical protein